MITRKKNLFIYLWPFTKSCSSEMKCERPEYPSLNMHPHMPYPNKSIKQQNLPSCLEEEPLPGIYKAGEKVQYSSVDE